MIQIRTSNGAHKSTRQYRLISTYVSTAKIVDYNFNNNLGLNNWTLQEKQIFFN